MTVDDTVKYPAEVTVDYAFRMDVMDAPSDFQQLS